VGSHGGDAGGDGIPLVQPHVRHPFLGRTVALERATSDATVHLIEEETQGILIGALDEARTASNRTAPRSTPLGAGAPRTREPGEGGDRPVPRARSRTDSVGRRGGLSDAEDHLQMVRTGLVSQGSGACCSIPSCSASPARFSPASCESLTRCSSVESRKSACLVLPREGGLERLTVGAPNAGRKQGA